MSTSLILMADPVFGGRLRLVQQHFTKTVSAFIDAIPASRQAVYDWFKADEPTPAALGAVLSAYPTVNPDWLTAGKGDMLLTSHGDGENRVAEPVAHYSPHEERLFTGSEAPDTIHVPIAPTGHSAGRGGTDNGGPHEVIPLSSAFVRRLTGGTLPERLFWTFVVGDSNEPYLHDGTPVLCEVTREVREAGRYVFWLDEDDGDRIKRIQPMGKGRLLVVSDNRLYQPRLLEPVQGEADMYRDVELGHTFKLRIQGRVLYPPDTGAAVASQLADFAKQLIR